MLSSAALISDNKKMIDFISRYIGEDTVTLVLAFGPGIDLLGKGDFASVDTADVTVYGDEIKIENCPEWVSLKDIYEYFLWRALPSYHHSQLMCGELLPITVSNLEDQIDTLKQNEAIENASFCFRRTGQIWTINFRIGSEIKHTQLNHNIGLKQMHRLLINRDRWVDSQILSSNEFEETLSLIASQRNQRKEDRFGDLSVSDLRYAWEKLKERVESSKLNGNLEGLEVAQEELDRFKEVCGDSDKEFYKKLGEKDSNHTLAEGTHKAVRKNMLRLFKSLRSSDIDMKECADHLERNIMAEGYGFAYRPSHPSPHWET